MSFATGTFISFVPLYGRSEGVANPGFFFTIFAVVMLVSRPVSGGLSDRFGRAAVAVPALVTMSAGLGLLAFSGKGWSLAISAAILGLGMGAAIPALMALMIDVVAPSERGGAMSTYGIGLDVGIGVGSVAQGMAAEAWGFGAAFAIAAALPLAAVAGYRIANRKARKAEA